MKFSLYPAALFLAVTMPGFSAQANLHDAISVTRKPVILAGTSVTPNAMTEMNVGEIALSKNDVTNVGLLFLISTTI